MPTANTIVHWVLLCWPWPVVAWSYGEGRQAWLLWLHYSFWHTQWPCLKGQGLQCITPCMACLNLGCVTTKGHNCCLAIWRSTVPGVEGFVGLSAMPPTWNSPLYCQVAFSPWCAWSVWWVHLELGTQWKHLLLVAMWWCRWWLWWCRLVQWLVSTGGLDSGSHVEE